MSSLFIAKQKRSSPERAGLGLGLGMLAIACFSVTLPVTRIGVTQIDPTVFGLGRSLLVLIPALLTLWWLRLPLPNRTQMKGLIIVALGVVIGFPWLSALAMESVSGAQAGIIVAVLPLFTAVAGAVLARQRPSLGFWLVGLLGSVLVLWFVWDESRGGISQGDLILLLASMFCAVGYAAGGQLAKEIGSIAVICWALVLSAPISVLILVSMSPEQNVDVSWQVWASFIYVALVSQWLAFMFWYQGLALGGVVRVSQVQLLQPFLTLCVSAWLLNEVINSVMIWFALAVVATVAVGRKMPIRES